MSARLGPDQSKQDVSTACANRMFNCHGCKLWINLGRSRTGVCNDANPSGWVYFCYECVTWSPAGGGTASSKPLPRPVAGWSSAEGEVARPSGGASSSSRPPRSQSSSPERAGCTWLTDCCGGADGDLDVGEEGKEEAPAEEEPKEV